MNELIKTNYDVNKDRVTVLGRELHKALGIKTPYSKWIQRMFEYGFTENEDYAVTDIFVHNSNGGKQSIVDHQITIDMAKELCMIQRSEKGKKFRKYFIEVEKDWNSPEKIMARALLMSKKELNNLNRQLEEMKPKALFADAVSGSKDSILVGELAKLITQNGYEIGQNNFFKWLTNRGYLYKKNGSYRPKQRYVEQGLFELKETPIHHNSGDIHLSLTVKVTGKGQRYFLNKFAN